MYRNVIATVLLLILDFIWIGAYMGGQYQRMIPNIQCNSPMTIKPLYAVLSYTLMAIGLNLFVLPNISKENALRDSLVYGFGFGIILYGVYDFTAAAVIKNWDIKLALMDILWGGFVYFIVAYIVAKCC